MYIIKNISNFWIKKIQAVNHEQTWALYLPKDFISVNGLAKGDYVKCTINDKRQLVVEKVILNAEQTPPFTIYECPHEHKEKCDRVFPLENSGNVKVCICKCHENVIFTSTNSKENTGNVNNSSVDGKCKEGGLI